MKRSIVDYFAPKHECGAILPWTAGLPPNPWEPPKTVPPPHTTQRGPHSSPTQLRGRGERLQVRPDYYGFLRPSWLILPSRAGSRQGQEGALPPQINVVPPQTKSPKIYYISYIFIISCPPPPPPPPGGHYDRAPLTQKPAPTWPPH